MALPNAQQRRPPAQQAQPGLIQPQPVQQQAPAPQQPMQPQPMQPQPAVQPYRPTTSTSPTPAAQWRPAPQPPAVQPFGPGNDLRFQQINPVAGQNEQMAQQASNQALQGLMGVDRGDLARQAWEQMAPQMAQGLNRRAAAAGALGSGPSQELFGRTMNEARSRMALQAANDQLADWQAKLGGAQGALGQQYGMGADRRDFLARQQAYQYGVGQDAMNRALLAGQMGQQQGQQMQQGAQDLIQQLAMQQGLQEYMRRQQQAPQPGRLPSTPPFTAPAFGSSY